MQLLAAVLHSTTILQIALLLGLFNQAVANQQYFVATNKIELLSLAREWLGRHWWLGSLAKRLGDHGKCTRSKNKTEWLHCVNVKNEGYLPKIAASTAPAMTLAPAALG